jgi:O-antigen/teichoic acid export membrane protein
MKIIEIIKKVFSYNILNFAVLMVTTIYISRSTLPSVVGASVAMIATAEVIALINDVSIGQQYMQNFKKIANANTAASLQILVAILFFILCLFCGFLIFPEHIEIFLFISLGKFISILYSINSAKIYILKLFSLEARINLLLTILSCFLSISVSILFDMYLLALAILYVIPKFSSLFAVKYAPLKAKFRFDSEEIKLYFTGGGALLISNGAQRLRSQLEKILFGYFFGSTELGMSTRGRTFTDTLPSLTFNTTRNIIFTSLIEKTECYRLYKRLLALDVLVIGAMLITLNVFSLEIVLLVLGENWKDSVRYIPSLSLLSMISLFINYERIVVLAKGKNINLSFFSIFEVLATLVSFLIFGYLFDDSVNVILLLCILLSLIGFFLTVQVGSNELLPKVLFITAFINANAVLLHALLTI